MASSPKSSNPTHPPLNRWKARFRIFNKPTLWISTSILLLTGLLIADYSRVQAGNLQIESTAETPDAINAANVLDQQPDTLDGIPLPDDPEQREWAIREANDLNSVIDEQDSGSNALNEDESFTLREVSENDSVPSIPSSEEHLLAHNLAKEDKDNDESDSSTRPRRNQQSTPPESVFSGYMDRTDDVLSLMGLKTQSPQVNRGTTLLEGNTENISSNLFSSPTRSIDTLPESALAQALQSLDTVPSVSTTADRDSLPSLSPILNSNINTVQPSLEGLPILQAPTIQTAPPPGTTGYIAPAPIAGTSFSAPGASTVAPIPTPNNAGPSIGIPSSTSGTALPLQPSVTLPPNSTPIATPTPVFTPPTPIDHTPYTGGGRNGRINTFSNP